MLRRRLCEAKFEWELSCEGPLLIADGRYDKQRGENQDHPNKVFVSRASEAKLRQAIGARAEDLKLPFYVPGTSLRGPFRAQAERIVRSLAPGDALPPATACDPFDMEEASPRSCSARLDREAADFPYARACPACKLFGCTATASRIDFADADLPPAGQAGAGRSVYRDMVGIDRFTGGAYPQAKFRLHALEDTRFTTSVAVRNFELWQLGLLAYVFQDFADGLVALGFGKAKGFGQVRGRVTKVTLTYPGGKERDRIHHLGSLCSDPEPRNYGLQTWAAPACEMAPVKQEGGLGLYESFEVKDLASFWRESAAAFNGLIAAAQRETA